MASETEPIKRVIKVENENDPRGKALAFIEERYYLAKSTWMETYTSYETTIGYYGQAGGAAELAVELGLITQEEADLLKENYKL